MQELNDREISWLSKILPKLMEGYKNTMRENFAGMEKRHEAVINLSIAKSILGKIVPNIHQKTRDKNMED